MRGQTTFEKVQSPLKQKSIQGGRVVNVFTTEQSLLCCAFTHLTPDCLIVETAGVSALLDASIFLK